MIDCLPGEMMILSVHSPGSLLDSKDWVPGETFESFLQNPSGIHKMHGLVKTQDDLTAIYLLATFLELTLSTLGEHLWGDLVCYSRYISLS